MKLSVYNGEIFKRGIIWYIIMGILFFVLVVATLFSSKILGDNVSWVPEWTDILSTVLMIALFWAYWFYVRKEIEKKIVLSIDAEKGLWIGPNFYQWHAVQWFSLEMWRNTKNIHNIIIFVNQGISIYTIDDNAENIDTFVKELVGHVNFSESFTQGFLNKLLRRAKI